MAKVTFYFSNKEFETKISLSDKELQQLKWILINAKALMKDYDSNREQNAYDEEIFNIDKMLKAIREHDNQFEN